MISSSYLYEAHKLLVLCNVSLPYSNFLPILCFVFKNLDVAHLQFSTPKPINVVPKGFIHYCVLFEILGTLIAHFKC